MKKIIAMAITALVTIAASAKTETTVKDATTMAEAANVAEVTVNAPEPGTSFNSFRHRRNHNSFSSVKVMAPVKLVMAHAPFYSVKVFSRDKELASSINYKIKDGELRISSSDLETLEQAHGHVTVVVTSPVDVEYKVGNDMVAVKVRE